MVYTHTTQCLGVQQLPRAPPGSTLNSPEPSACVSLFKMMSMNFHRIFKCQSSNIPRFPNRTQSPCQDLWVSDDVTLSEDILEVCSSGFLRPSEAPLLNLFNCSPTFSQQRNKTLCMVLPTIKPHYGTFSNLYFCRNMF